MLCFDKLFLLKEVIRRKKYAKLDGENCIKAAMQLGLKKTGGTKEFPVFSKTN